ncbi:uncharacterized protein B0I36DRAFT_344968 [Microdochium trichocladiopsis]|uniref:NodB homology domain-containing protein n=1 Tax=Microdochium trichocladiopsis TaxID=1682393 RepID=A0A9P8YGM4_9PEZI|nr:uncharacterized protein B0I36DRAFT_344968 [Microdochium trichocladiopsis]KAH7041357.1 hypothetical protein B0I36DRAFT_344968 [Microdochium trichocladiopsis]
MKIHLTLLAALSLESAWARTPRWPVSGSQESSLDTVRPDTSRQIRRADSEVAYGTLIEDCANKKQIAVTLDDGPSEYTQRVLDEFAKYAKDGFKATFFVTGNNMCPITDDRCAKIVRAALKAGHQIASHTWRHEDLDAIGTDARAEQMNLNKEALAKVLDLGGKAPTYMRPPYGTCGGESGCLKDMGDLGYHVVNWNIDTTDWMYCDSEEGCKTSVELFDSQFDSKSQTGFIVLDHDIKEYTASVLIPHILKRAKETGYKVVTVGECLNDPKENWYKKW